MNIVFISLKERPLLPINQQKKKSIGWNYLGSYANLVCFKRVNDREICLFVCYNRASFKILMKVIRHTFLRNEIIFDLNILLKCDMKAHRVAIKHKSEQTKGVQGTSTT